MKGNNFTTMEGKRRYIEKHNPKVNSQISRDLKIFDLSFTTLTLLTEKC